ncbi:MAG: hypothetical protein GC186_14990 [Rhodobacteraceae bacterium]|nr:hypothetical protein [Paracoccaceae bacterium]
MVVGLMIVASLVGYVCGLLAWLLGGTVFWSAFTVSASGSAAILALAALTALRPYGPGGKRRRRRCAAG